MDGGFRWRENRDGVLSPTLVAFQIKWGMSSGSTPFDELHIPGGGTDAEWPLRAHRRAYDGIIGRTPLAQRIVLGNLELRHWLFDFKNAQMGIVFAYSPAVIYGIVLPEDRNRRFQDVGIGLRIAGFFGMNLRMDIGFGLLDGTKAVFLGWNEWF
jgi:hypothetical protein